MYFVDTFVLLSTSLGVVNDTYIFPRVLFGAPWVRIPVILTLHLPEQFTFLLVPTSNIVHVWY